MDSVFVAAVSCKAPAACLKAGKCRYANCPQYSESQPAATAPAQPEPTPEGAKETKMLTPTAGNGVAKVTKRATGPAKDLPGGAKDLNPKGKKGVAPAATLNAAGKAKATAPKKAGVKPAVKKVEAKPAVAKATAKKGATPPKAVPAPKVAGKLRVTNVKATYSGRYVPPIMTVIVEKFGSSDFTRDDVVKILMSKLRKSDEDAHEGVQYLLGRGVLSKA